MPYCENCGSEISEQTKFCRSCGQKVTQSLKQPPPPPPQHPPQYPYGYYPEQASAAGVGGVICGVIGLCLGWAIPLIGIILGIIALALGGVAMSKQQRYGIAGIILGILSLVFAVIFWMLWFIYLSSLY